MYESGNIQREPFQLLKLSWNSNIIVPSRNCSFSSLRGFFSKLFPIFVFNEECLKDLILCFKLKSFEKWKKLFNVGRVLVGIIMLFSSNSINVKCKWNLHVFFSGMLLLKSTNYIFRRNLSVQCYLIILMIPFFKTCRMNVII